MTALLLTLGLAFAADPNTPHPHNLVKPITSKPAAWKLTGAQQAQLEKGEVVKSSTRTKVGGTGRAAQLIHAIAWLENGEKGSAAVHYTGLQPLAWCRHSR